MARGGEAITLIAMTTVIVPVAVADADALTARARAAGDAGAGLVELRLDRCRTAGADLGRLLAEIPRLPLPVLATNRCREEGGDWAGDEEERLHWLLRAATAGAAWIDVELSAVHRLPRRPPDAELIVSHHDFQGMGADLTERVEAMFGAEADVAKVAVTPRDAGDLAVLAALHRRFHASPLMAIGMGTAGLASRLVAGCWGAPFTFARLADDDGSAPGQPTVADILGAYRLDAQGPATRIYGIAGPAADRSPLPRILNAAFASHGADAVCVPLVADTGFTADWLAGVAEDGAGGGLARRCAALFERWTGERAPLAVIRRATEA
jgi:3-dehydroquinate dehydratase type I